MSQDPLKCLSPEEVQKLDRIWHGTPEPLRKVLDAVAQYERTGKHEYMARCVMPDHEDTNPSLHITWNPMEGRVLLYCHGCKAPYMDLIKAMGLSPEELRMAIPEQEEIVATYDYCDEKGQLLYQVVRYEPKAFRQRRPDGDGGWIWDLKGVRRVLYRLPELLSAGDPVVWIVEGEKDVETLVEYEYVATTSGAAGSWKSDFGQYFAGRHVVIVPDADEPGRRHADCIAHDLFDVAKTVKIVNLPHGKDISDFLSTGGNEDELRILPRTARLVQEPPVYPTGPDIVRLSDVELKEVRWLWPDRIPLGKLTLLAGEAGIGKSLLTLDMAARVSRGSVWPDGQGEPEQGTVLIFTSEDDTEDTVAVRLAAANADLSKVIHVKNVFDMCQAVKKATKIMEGGDAVKLIIMDPISEFLGSADSHKNADVRRALTPIIAFAAERGVAVLGVTHYAKAERTSASSKIIGSIAFNAAARQVWHVIEDGGRKLFVRGKANLSGQYSGLAYTLAEATVRHKDKELSTVRIEFDKEPVLETAQDVLLRFNHNPNKTEMAKAFLRVQLAEGPKEKSEVERAAAGADIKEHTLRRAREELGVKIDQRGKGEGRQSFWRLPS